MAITVSVPTATGKKKMKVNLKAKKTVSAPVAAAVRKIAKQAVQGEAETMEVTRLVEDNVGHNSAISGADLQVLLPTINQGDDDYQRKGDVIRPLKLVVKGLIAANRTFTDTNQSLLVRVVIVSPKATKSAAVTVPLFATYANELLQPNLQTGTQVIPFNGNQAELLYPINRDQFNVHYDKIFKISPCASAETGGGIEENPAEVRMWSKTIKLPKKLTYDTGFNLPNNFCPIFGLGYAFADGTGPDLVSTRIISTVTARLSYKDM